ncbi:MAG: iron-containing alcohol dehydrogenase [Pseudomonadota bacterium]
MRIKEIITEFKIPIQEILIARNLIDEAADLIFNLHITKQKILLVTDQNIYPIAQRIIDQLSCPSLVLQSPKADEANVAEIIHHAQSHDLIIAVGSGVINDLCKVASFRLKIPYIIFGTAPSMNGYASANASITVGGSPYLGGASLRQQTMGVHGYKTSIPAHLPTAIYLDLDVLENAPLRLIKSGIGDSLCFSTCQFDWLLSHLILGTYYNPTPFDLLKSHYQQLTTHDLQLTTLTEMLIISGLGMYICGGSYPASQAEHLIAHYIEILYPQIAQNTYHGEQIAVCTLSVAELQEKILQQENLQIRATNFNQNDLEKIFDKDLAEHFFSEINKKAIDENLANKINQHLQANWHNIRAELQKTFISKNDLLKSYRKFALPEKCEEIGFEEKIYNQALTNAHLIRNRFTSLDLEKIVATRSLPS